jgi:hypothetical protein
MMLSQLSSIKNCWRDRFIETMMSHVFFVGGNAGDALSVQTAAGALPVVDEASQQKEKQDAVAHGTQ